MDLAFLGAIAPFSNSEPLVTIFPTLPQIAAQNIGKIASSSSTIA
jgi:hypothetical protein